METNQKPWKTMKPPWKTMETKQKPWNHLGKPWKPTKNHENFQKKNSKNFFPKKSDDFSLQTNTQTLHHNIYIVIIIITVVIIVIITVIIVIVIITVTINIVFFAIIVIIIILILINLIQIVLRYDNICWSCQFWDFRLKKCSKYKGWSWQKNLHEESFVISNKFFHGGLFAHV